MGYAASVKRNVEAGGIYRRTQPGSRAGLAPGVLGSRHPNFSPADDDVIDLPKYAAFVSRRRPEGTLANGYMAVHLKSGIRGRATFTPGDSFSSGLKGVRGVTSLDQLWPLFVHGDEELTRLAFAEATGFAYDLEISAMTESGRLRTRYNYDDKYYEAQIHGDISWSDVERVIIYCETDYYGELMEAAEAADHLEQFASDNGYHFPVRILRGSHAGPGGFRTSAEVFAELAPNNRT